MQARSYVYEIRIEETLTGGYEEWFPHIAAVPARRLGATAGTALSGTFDQAALFGVLARIRDFNLTLVSVHRTDDERDV